MAAPLSSFAGNVIYLDTMLPYLLLRGIAEAVPFFERIERAELAAYTSVLAFDELGYRLLLAFIKDHYDGSPFEHLRNQEAQSIAEFAPAIAALLRRLREMPNMTILDVLASDLDAMNEAMIQYHLRPRDALHFAAMRRIGCLDLASNDSHFDRIPAVRRYSL